jgi:hypothetical protein
MYLRGYLQHKALTRVYRSEVTREDAQKGRVFTARDTGQLPPLRFFPPLLILSTAGEFADIERAEGQRPASRRRAGRLQRD